MTFQPVDPVELLQLTEQVRVSGLRNDQARFVVHALARTEAERQRLQAQVEGAGEHRRGLRDMMNDEAQRLRERVTDLETELTRLRALIDGAHI